jgi:RimJ/RimL family protein N-acetyltransferase
VPDERPPLKDLILKSIARLKARGPREASSVASARAHEWFGSEDRLVILVRDCTEEDAEREGLVLRRATADDADAYARFIGTDSAVTFIRRLSATSTCYLAFEGYRILHATWCTYGAAWTRELHAYLVPPAEDAYVYESFTRADARGKGIYPFALRGIAADLHRDGRKRVWVGVEAHNEPSLRAVAKGGFTEAFSIRFGRRWGRVWVKPDTTLSPSESLHITTNPASP